MLPTYSMTECMPIASPPPGYRLSKPGSVGPPLSGLVVHIVDPASGEAMAAGQHGEICLAAGPQLFTGYENLPSPFVSSPEGGDTVGGCAVGGGNSRFGTGDLGYLDADGWLYHVGRHAPLSHTYTHIHTHT